MIDANIKNQYTVTVGIECHVQLKTVTKLFSAVANDAREAEPNTLVSHICFGLPGALPVLNKEAVRLASLAGFALNSGPQKFSKFDRKHYFYPDLPLGYQITQFDEPIVLGGSVIIDTPEGQKVIGITRAHLEADAGKSTHPAGGDYSLVDLNRAGTPLLEIVSEPDMHTAGEAKAYARELYLRMKYADVSDCNLYYGNMRFDVNVSVSKTDTLGTRTETKNLNSFRSIEKAIEYEITRQIEVLESGGEIVQETRGWNDDKQKTFSQRSKEDAHDYRYFPDPDLPPVLLSDDYIAAVKNEMPIMPDTWRERLGKLQLDKALVETLLDQEVASDSVSYLPLLDEVSSQPEFVRALANWLVNLEIPLRADENAQIGTLKDADRLELYQKVYELLKANKLSSTNAKSLLTDVLKVDSLPVDIELLAKDNGYIQESDEGAIGAIVAEVIAANPKAAEDVANGEMKAIGFLTGQVMKASQGKANPALATQLIKQQLGITHGMG
ncbi:MAG: Asp-tRNA(Asn)/Glu-tRNA(Gln) amidotransferase subunit GatB [Candidatus Saccharimonadales bacterium]